MQESRFTKTESILLRNDKLQIELVKTTHSIVDYKKKKKQNLKIELNS